MFFFQFILHNNLFILFDICVYLILPKHMSIDIITFKRTMHLIDSQYDLMICTYSLTHEFNLRVFDAVNSNHSSSFVL